MTRSEAYALSLPIKQAIAPVCEVAEFAGSVRRGKPGVHDVEIVCVPSMAASLLFDDIPASAGENNARLDTIIKDLIRAGVMALDPFVRRDGDKLKRFKVRPTGTGVLAPVAEDWLTLELYIASVDNFGPIMFIRTGDKDFTRTCVTPWNEGGLMPYGYRQKDGYLQRADTDDKGEDIVWTTVPCPSEEAYFLVLGLLPGQIPEPSARYEATALALRDVIRGNQAEDSRVPDYSGDDDRSVHQESDDE
jgi:hypothetical protein